MSFAITGLVSLALLIAPAEDREKPHSLDAQNRPMWFTEPAEVPEVITTGKRPPMRTVSSRRVTTLSSPEDPELVDPDVEQLPAIAVSVAADYSDDKDAASLTELPEGPDAPPEDDPEADICEAVSRCVPELTLCDRGCRDWTMELGALALVRRRPDADILVHDPTDTSRRIDANDFSFNLQTGFEAAFTNHRGLNDVWDIETRFFRVHDWSASQSLRINSNPIPINNTPPTFVSGPRQIESRYSTDLQNLEWTLRRPIRRDLELLIGARAISIHEKLQTRLTSLLTPPISTEDYFVRTRNRLYGLQIGLSRSLVGDACQCVQVYGKLGAYVNQAEQRSALVNYLSPPVRFRIRQRDGQPAFVGELGIKAKWRLRENMSFVAGYRGLWVDGLALASEQVPRTNFSGVTNLNNDGSVFYHGGLLGLEIWL